METILHNTFFNADILAGVVFLLMGGFMRLFPPRSLRALYGYHSHLARRNQHTWQEANQYAANYSLKLSTILIATGIGAGLVFDAQTYWFYILTVGTVIIAVMLLRGETEWHLSHVFDEEGNRRKKILSPEEYRESLRHSPAAAPDRS